MMLVLPSSPISFCFNGSFSAWGNSSDSRDKTNVETIGVGRTFLGQLRPVKFEWDYRDEENRNGSTQGTEEAGFLAQEVKQVVDDNNAEYLKLVNENDPEKLGLYKANFVPVLVKAIQELNQEVENLKAEIRELRGDS